MAGSPFSLRSAALLGMASAGYAAAEVYHIGNAPYSGSTDVEFQSRLAQLDGQKITPYPNGTQYEWWYFDVASTSSANESSVIAFMQLTAESFPAAGPGDFFTPVAVSGTFENGTEYQFSVQHSNASSVTVTTDLNGASGIWGDSGISFKGDATMSEYVLTFDNAEAGVKGSMTMQSISPPHYPCGPAEPFSNEVICPSIGWSNAVPAARGTVDLTVGDTHTSFTGVGYHDKNWGDKPFLDAIQSWYWGHAQVGPYSLVWFDTIAIDGTEYASGYVAEDGRMVKSSCAEGAVKVRPIGAAYPPKATDPAPTGYTIEYDLGYEGQFEFTTTSDFLTSMPGYGRYLGNMKGGRKGCESYEGRSLGEEFVFAT